MILDMKCMKVLDKHTKKIVAATFINVKMHALSYMIKYLPCLTVNIQAAIHKNLLLARCKAFEHVELTTIYVIKIFHLHYRELALLHSSLLTVTKLTSIR